MNERTCSMEDCDRPYSAKDYCKLHYERNRVTGGPNGTLRTPKPVVKCAVDDCTYTGRLWRGWCAKHYGRWKKTGDPLTLPPRTPKLKATCSVDECDRDSSSQGYCPTHYARYRRSGTPGDAEIKIRHRGTWKDNPDRATCWSCGEEKTAGEFSRKSADPANPLYEHREHQCKDCLRAGSAAWREANREFYNERMTVAQMKSLYGMSPDQYQALLTSQGGGCAICGQKPKPGDKRLHIDHDHDTGSIRGVLCGWCNTSLGLFRDDARLLIRAAEYLERSAA